MRMIEGVRHYQEQSVEREETPHRVIWSKANARLLDYGGDADAPAVLFIPSLINRHHILDLYAKRSLVKFLRDAGLRVITLDWGEPSARERRYGLSEYTDYLLLDALDALRRKHNGPLNLAGYCMGGLFALAAAQLRPESVDGLLLLATPWQRLNAPALAPKDWTRFEEQIRTSDTVPPLVTQTMFHLLDPWHFQSKFARYPAMSTAEKAHFNQVEQWVNDGVPLSRYVAQQCYIDWPRDDFFAAQKWRVRGQIISPSQVHCPALVVTPTHDKIVPLHSSEPLASLIPNAQSLKPKSGHISMLVGSKAKQTLWEPLLEWIETTTQN
jgi:polyhydroxyalkanoate synthase